MKTVGRLRRPMGSNPTSSVPQFPSVRFPRRLTLGNSGLPIRWGPSRNRNGKTVGGLPGPTIPARFASADGPQQGIAGSPSGPIPADRRSGRIISSEVAGNRQAGRISGRGLRRSAARQLDGVESLKDSPSPLVGSTRPQSRIIDDRSASENEEINRIPLTPRALIPRPERYRPPGSRLAPCFHIHPTRQGSPRWERLQRARRRTPAPERRPTWSRPS